MHAHTNIVCVYWFEIRYGTGYEHKGNVWLCLPCMHHKITQYRVKYGDASAVYTCKFILCSIVLY